MNSMTSSVLILVMLLQSVSCFCNPQTGITSADLGALKSSEFLTKMFSDNVGLDPQPSTASPKSRSPRTECRPTPLRFPNLNTAATTRDEIRWSLWDGRFFFFSWDSTDCNCATKHKSQVPLNCSPPGSGLAPRVCPRRARHRLPHLQPGCSPGFRLRLQRTD